MASNNSKPGMMIYFDYWYAPLRILSGDEVKELLTDMIALSKDGQYPENFSCENVKVFFNQMEAVILRDDEQYTQKIEQRRRAGKASHESRQRMSADANECQRPLTDADECQRLSTNSTQHNSAQFKSIQSNSAQYISTQTNRSMSVIEQEQERIWQERCTALGVNPDDQRERNAHYENTWKSYLAAQERTEADDDLAF